MKAPRIMPKNEAALQKWFVKGLKDARHLVYKFSSPAKRGVPDLIIIRPNGSVFFVEMKNPMNTGLLSKLQQVEIEAMLLQNAEVYIASDVEDCIDIFRGVGSKIKFSEIEREYAEL